MRNKQASLVLTTLTGLAALIASSVVAGFAGAAIAQGRGPNPVFGVNGVTIEGVILKRGDLDGTPLTKADDANGSNPGLGGPFEVVSSAELDPGTGEGVRVTLDGWVFGSQVRYSVLGGWGFEGSFARSFGGPGISTDASFELPGADNIIFNSDKIEAISAEHESWFVSGDSSFYPFAPPDQNGVKFLWGTRSIFLNDELSAVVFDDLDDFFGAGTDIDRIGINVDNRMIGLQAGLEGEMPVSENVSLGGFVKGGLMANFVDVESSFTSDNNAANVLNKSYDGTKFAQFAEGSGSVIVKLGERTSLVASGMLLWINGIAEAANHFSQVTDSQAKSINADTDVLFYGGRIGVKVKLGGSAN